MLISLLSLVVQVCGLLGWWFIAESAAIQTLHRSIMVEKLAFVWNGDHWGCSNIWSFRVFWTSPPRRIPRRRPLTERRDVIRTDHFIWYTLRVSGRTPFNLQNCLNPLWHRVNKVLETFLTFWPNQHKYLALLPCNRLITNLCQCAVEQVHLKLLRKPQKLVGIAAHKDDWNTPYNVLPPWPDPWRSEMMDEFYSFFWPCMKTTLRLRRWAKLMTQEPTSELERGEPESS